MSQNFASSRTWLTGRYTKQEVTARADEGGVAKPEGPNVIATELRADDAQPDLPLQVIEQARPSAGETHLHELEPSGHMVASHG